jgi:hypothetical protein
MRRRTIWTIDADIGCAAGKSDNPVSKNSRKFLQFVLQSELEIVMNKKLFDEWRSHRSIFSAKWLTSMYARKRVITVEETESISKELSELGLDENEIAIVAKDSHLLDAAHRAGKSIASGDSKTRRILKRINFSSINLREVIWINPKTEAADIVSAFESGGIAKPEWFL